MHPRNMMKTDSGPCMLHFTLTTALRDYYFSDKGRIRKTGETGAGTWTQAASWPLADSKASWGMGRRDPSLTQLSWARGSKERGGRTCSVLTTSTAAMRASSRPFTWTWTFSNVHTSPSGVASEGGVLLLRDDFFRWHGDQFLIVFFFRGKPDFSVHKTSHHRNHLIVKVAFLQISILKSWLRKYSENTHTENTVTHFQFQL